MHSCAVCIVVCPSHCSIVIEMVGGKTKQNKNAKEKKKKDHFRNILIIFYKIYKFNEAPPPLPSPPLHKHGLSHYTFYIQHCKNAQNKILQNKWVIIYKGLYKIAMKHLIYRFTRDIWHIYSGGYKNQEDIHGLPCKGF